jgi:HlyD family secretion protein
MKKCAKIIIGVTCAGIAVCAGIWFYISSQSTNASDTAYVETVSDAMGISQDTERMSGVVESQDSLQIKADSSKKIAAVYVTEGQSVKNGDSLFQYDSSDAQNNIASANLDIEGTQNEITQLKSDITDLQNQKNAAAEADKYQYSSDISSKQLQITQDEYSIQSKQADVAKYQKEIDSSTVKATFDGVISTLNSDVSSSSTDTSDKPFMVITQTGEFRVKGTLDEQSVGLITQGMNVIVRSRVDESQTWNGTVTLIETQPQASSGTDTTSSTDTGNTASKYPFYITLNSSEGLMLGQHVFIEADNGQGTQKDGIWLNSAYVVTDDKQSYVWADDNGKLKKQSVETGKSDDTDGTVEITSGLKKDTLIAWPDDSFREGQPTAKQSTGK